MSRIMHLPGGVRFDPETGEFQGGDIGVVRPIPLATSRHHVVHMRTHNIWQRFNNGVSRIGYWFAEHSESITNYCAMVLFIISWLFFALAVIMIWVHDGFWTALLRGGIAGVIFYYISMITIGVFIWIANIVLAIIRYIFYSAYTFLGLVIIVSIVLFIIFA